MLKELEAQVIFIRKFVVPINEAKAEEDEDNYVLT